ncbi:MAG: hypothetical protein V3T86_04560 [Planctomycetota bacterium]
MECEACGSHNVSRRRIEGNLVEECNLCGHLSGDDAAVAEIEELRDGRERGLDDHIIPLVTSLEKSDVFQVLQATGGSEDRGTFPQVLFRMPSNDARNLERLVRSVELAGRGMATHWIVELSLQSSLVYILRPRFWKPAKDVARSEIVQAQEDAALLAKKIRRDIRLSWWNT